MAGLPQFRVLGPFEARSPDGAAIDFSHRKVRALLVYLTIEHGRPQSREHLATLLWARTGDDRAHRNLMELLARTGQRSEALRQYQECATALAQELGAEPGPETNQLVTEIRQGRFMPPGVGAAATMASRAAHDGEQPQLQPRVVATILVAEADGYEQSRDDDDGSGRILRRYLHVLAGRVGKHRGSIVQQAEGAVMAQFEESVDALTCAMSVQRGLSEANSDLDEASRVRCRIGVDRGSVTRDRNEIRGDAVNVAMRLEALAEPGGICISDAVRSSAEGRVCASFQFIGEHRARNVLNPVRAYSVAEQPGQITAVGAGTPRVPTAALALPGKPSLVKKPFRNMSADAEQDYFAEGLTKDISIALTKIPGLFLAADESPTARVSQGLSATEMGREFGLRYVLIGGVRRHGERVRVNAELIDAANGQCLWGERFDRELHDLFSIQDEITEEIVTALDVKLVQGEAARFMRKALTNPVALEASYRGWYALYHGTGRQDVREAQHLFEEVIRLEPEAPIGYAGAALAYWAEAGFGRVVVHSPAMEHAADLAREALSLGDTTGYAHLVMALVHLAHHEYDEAMTQVTEGVAARPNCNGAYAIKSSVLNYLGRPQEAIEFAQYAVRLTPVYPAEFPAALAAAYHDSGRYAEAIAAAAASLQLRNEDIDPMLILVAANVAQGNLDEARAIAAKVQDLDPAFRLAEFSATQPYRNPQDLERLIGRLHEAGLPN